MRSAFLLATIVILFSLSCLAQESRSRLLPVELNGKVGYINTKGEIVIKPQYDYGWKFSEGFACVVVNGKTGFIDESGAYLVKPQFNSTYGCFTEFREGFAPVHIDYYPVIKGKRLDKSKWGFVDTKGKITFFPNVRFLSGFREGLAFFKRGNLTGYLDKNFKIIIKPKFKSAGDFYQGRARATDINGSQYYIDQNGQKLFKNFDGCDFQNGMACFNIKGKWGYINWNGEAVIKAKFEQGNYFGENGLAAVKVGDKWGFINKDGEFVIKPQFDDAVEFKEGLASVEINGKRGFINESGMMIIAPQFDKWIYWFENGISDVRVEGKVGYIDKSGRFIWKPTN